MLPRTSSKDSYDDYRQRRMTNQEIDKVLGEPKYEQLITSFDSRTLKKEKIDIKKFGTKENEQAISQPAILNKTIPQKKQKSNLNSFSFHHQRDLSLTQVIKEYSNQPETSEVNKDVATFQPYSDSIKKQVEWKAKYGINQTRPPTLKNQKYGMHYHRNSENMQQLKEQLEKGNDIILKMKQLNFINKLENKIKTQNEYDSGPMLDSKYLEKTYNSRKV